MSSAYTVTRRRAWFRFWLGIVLGAGLGIIVTDFTLVRPAQKNVERALADLKRMSADYNTLRHDGGVIADENDEALRERRKFCEQDAAALSLLDPKHPVRCGFKDGVMGILPLGRGDFGSQAAPTGGARP